MSRKKKPLKTEGKDSLFVLIEAADFLDALGEQVFGLLDTTPKEDVRPKEVRRLSETCLGIAGRLKSYLPEKQDG